MARYTKPKNRVARKFGVNIFGKLRNPLLHKPNPPGMHGAKKRKKSDFGMQLSEQQKLRAIYGMLSRKQLTNCYKTAARSAGNTPQLFVERLECRLDNIVYRLKWASSIFAAGQLVSHGHILVNGKKVDRRSFFVRHGMIVSLRPKSQDLAAVKQAQENVSREIPEYLSADPAKYTGHLLVSPQVDQVPFPLPLNVPLICEFLAHSS